MQPAHPLLNYGPFGGPQTTFSTKALRKSQVRQAPESLKITLVVIRHNVRGPRRKRPDCVLSKRSPKSFIVDEALHDLGDNMISINFTQFTLLASECWPNKQKENVITGHRERPRGPSNESILH